jgi:hypothetical protein
VGAGGGWLRGGLGGGRGVGAGGPALPRAAAGGHCNGFWAADHSPQCGGGVLRREVWWSPAKEKVRARHLAR